MREKIYELICQFSAQMKSRDETLDAIFELVESLPRERRGKNIQLMHLPQNSAYPLYDRVHPQDDWCAKAGCIPIWERRAGRTDWRKLCEELTRYLDIFLCYDLQDHPKNRAAAEEALVRYNSAVQSEGKQS